MNDVKEQIKHRADHYSRLDPQPIRYMQKAMSKDMFSGFCLGNIIKYSLRFGHKDAKEKEAAKIRDYAKWLYENESGKAVSIE